MPVVLLINSRGTIKEKTVKGNEVEVKVFQKLAGADDSFACLHNWTLPECDGAVLSVYAVEAPVPIKGVKKNPHELPMPMDRRRITGTMVLSLSDAAGHTIDLPLESWRIIDRQLHNVEEDISGTPRKPALEDPAPAAPPKRQRKRAAPEPDLAVDQASTPSSAECFASIQEEPFL